MRIKPGPTLVCFQEVSQLATEEASIFRQMGPADRLSSLVIRRLNSGSNVCVFFGHCALVIIHLFLGVCAYSCVCVFFEDGAVDEDFSH